MRMQKAFLRGSVAVIGLVACGFASAETTICTAITQGMLPYVIATPGIYCVNQKLTTNMSSGAAITINASNVVLDLNANAIGNLLAPALTTTAIGVLANSRQNVTVQNGIVRGFWIGIALVDLAAPGTASGNAVHGITSDQSRAVGIFVEGSGSAVRNSRVVATNGSTAMNSLFGSGPPSISNGIDISGAGAQVIGNEVIDTDCTNGCPSVSGTIGIEVFNAPGAVVWQNRVVNGAMATATTSQAISIEPTSPHSFVDYNYLAGYSQGLVFGSNGTPSDGKYRSTLTNNVTTPYTGGTAVGTNN